MEKERHPIQLQLQTDNFRDALFSTHSEPEARNSLFENVISIREVRSIKFCHQIQKLNLNILLLVAYASRFIIALDQWSARYQFLRPVVRSRQVPPFLKMFYSHKSVISYTYWGIRWWAKVARSKIGKCAHSNRIFLTKAIRVDVSYRSISGGFSFFYVNECNWTLNDNERFTFLFPVCILWNIQYSYLSNNYYWLVKKLNEIKTVKVT